MTKHRQKDSFFKQILPFTATKGDLRKMEIVRATIKCIAQQGYENTNYETIGQVAHMKRPHVCYHFPNKDELILTAIRFVFAVGQETVVDYLKHADGSKEELLKSYIEGTFAWLTDNKGFAQVLALATYLSSVGAPYRKLVTEFKQIGEARVRLMVNANDAVAEQIHTYILGRCVYWLSCELDISLKDFVAETHSQVAKLVKRKS